MAVSIFGAACRRWDAKTMHTLISPLRLDKVGGPNAEIEAISSGTSSPDGETLPRSRYCESTATLEDTTAASKVYHQFFILTCYSLEYDAILAYQDLIIDNFENGHKQSADPFALLDGEGCVIDLDYEDMQKSPGNAEIKFVEVVFRCRYAVPRIRPS